MFNLKPAFPEADKFCRTYATRENAERGLERVVSQFAGIAEITYLIAVTDGGRFYPVLIPSEAQVQTAIDLAHQGIAFVRR